MFHVLYIYVQYFMQGLLWYLDYLNCIFVYNILTTGSCTCLWLVWWSYTSQAGT